MKPMNSVRLILQLTIILLPALPGLALNAQPVSVLGFQPAHSDHVVELPVPGSMTGLREILLIECDLFVSASGGLDSARQIQPGDSIRFDRIADSLLRVTLQPAQLNGEAVPSILPASILLEPRSTSAELLLPLRPDGSVRDYPGFERCLSLNGIQPAQVDSFPRYSFQRAEVDSLLNAPPYLLMRLKLDSSGQLIKSEIVASTIETYDRQIANAANWAEYSPAEIRDTELAAELWLVFSIYSQAAFPAPVWRRADSSSMSPWERLRLRALPDTVGLMQYPVPRRIDPLNWTATGDHVRIRDTILVGVRIDTAGSANLSQMSVRDRVVLSSLRTIVGGTRFWPAVGFDGSPEAFEGRMRFIFQGVRTVRIDCLWLPL